MMRAGGAGAACMLACVVVACGCAASKTAAPSAQAAAAAGTTSAASAAPAADPAAATITPAVLTWMQGRWIGQDGDALYEEQWSLQGDALVGVARVMHQGRSKEFELFALEPKDGQYVMRLRMFGPALDTATRGKDAPLQLRLVEADGTHFTCVGIGPEEGTTLTYQRWEGGGIRATIQKVRQGAVVWRQEFTFTRAPDVR